MLTIWNPLLPTRANVSNHDNEISQRDLFDRVFENTWRDMFSAVDTGVHYDKAEDGIYISVDMPGVKESDLNVSVRNNLVEIRAERKSERKGRYTQSISKSFTIPKGYDRDNIEAALQDGVLTLKLAAKQEPEQVVRKIELKKMTEKTENKTGAGEKIE